MTRLFVDVDTQYDFCDPSGALFVAGAPSIMDNVRTLVRHAMQTESLILSSVDSHNFTAWEFEQNGGPFPPHCVKGTRGWLKMEGTLPERHLFVPPILRDAREGIDPSTQAVIFEKEVYSLFANPEAEPLIDRLLADRGESRSSVEMVLFGVATDYCVKEAALGLAERSFSVLVVSDAIASITPEGEKEALHQMKEAGCRFIRTKGLL